jgi:hypothetical protein
MLSKILRLIPMIGLLYSPAIAEPPRPIPDDLVISMQRGNCEGGCPVYRILIFANGDVIWQGRARVAKLGAALGTIERDQIRTLIERFESADYFKLENIYGFRGSGCTSQKPDTPMVITSLSMGGIAKTLSHHDGCVGEVSEKLTAIEDSIDKAVNAGRWITGKSSGKKQ